MSDIEFCKEFVKRIERPARRKTELELIAIVEKKLDIQAFFSSSQLKELRLDSVFRFVHNFVFNNKHLFLGDNNGKSI